MEPTITPREMIRILPELEYNTALKFVELAEKIGPILKTRYANGHNT